MSYTEDVLNDPLHYRNNVKDEPLIFIPKSQVEPLLKWLKDLQEFKIKLLAKYIFDEKEAEQERGVFPTNTSTTNDKKENGGWDNPGAPQPPSESGENDFCET